MPTHLLEPTTTEEKEAQDQVWHRAIVIHDGNLSKKHKLGALKGASGTQEGKSLEELLETAIQTARDDANPSTCGALSQSAGSAVLAELQSIAPVFDVMTQGAPFAVSIAWGAVHLLIVLAARAQQAHEDILYAIARILRQVGAWRKNFLYLVRHKASLEPIAWHLAHVVDYLIRVKRYYSRQVVHFRLAFSSNKLDSIARKIEQARIDVESQLHALGRQANHRLIEDSLSRHGAVLASIQDLAEQQANVASVVERTHPRAQPDSFDYRVAAMRHWLQSHQLIRAKPCAKAPIDTARWILEHSSFKSWKECQDDGLFWIHGRPGAGKTTVSTLLREKLSQRITNKVLLVSVEAPTAPTQCPVTQTLFALLWQLLDSGADLSGSRASLMVDALERLRATAGSARTGFRLETECGMDEFIRCMESVTRACAPVHIVLDGLDLLNCRHLPNEQALASEFLDSLLRLSREPGISLIICSRPTPWIQRQLSNTRNICISPETSTKHILEYVEREILAYNKLSSVQDETIATVRAKADGNWIWAHLIMDHLIRALTVSEMKAYLACAPQRLTEMYHDTNNKREAALSELQVVSRRRLMSTIAVAAQPMTATELNEALAIDPVNNFLVHENLLLDPEVDIVNLCEPFVVADCGRFCFFHETVRDFVLDNVVSRNGAIESLLGVCLSALLDSKYRKREYCEALLKANSMPVAGRLQQRAAKPKEPPLYEHAVLHWHEYAVQLDELSETLRSKIALLLATIAFVAYAENLWIFGGSFSFDLHFHVKLMLERWFRTLDPANRPSFDVSQFFTQPYETLSHLSAQESTEPVLQYLSILRCAEYLTLAARNPDEFERVYEYNDTVAEGYLKYLGPRNPATLNAQRETLKRCYDPMDYMTALAGYRRIEKIQLEELDSDDIDIFQTRFWTGVVYFGMAQARSAKQILDEVRNRFSQQFGASSKQYLIVSLFQCFNIESSGKYDEARTLYEEIYEKWIPQNGMRSPFATNLLTAFGSLHRKQGEYGKAETMLLESWGSRLVQLTLQNQHTVDSGLHLALLYREKGDLQSSSRYLDEIADSRILELSFQRQCEFRHLKALVAFDQGEYSRPKNDLLRLIMETTGDNRGQNNLEAMFVRLTLAEALRDHGENDQAPMLFQEIVKRIEASSEDLSASEQHCPPMRRVDGSESPVLVETLDDLEAAEEALTLVRDAKVDEATAFLASQGLVWVREKDLWIMTGGPKVDTNSARYQRRRRSQVTWTRHQHE